ncbi:hypothetical protein JOD31_002017 [Methylopila capsulata]|uniref:Uncharacterized protein n=1 Tax=Methylopila capsulata TaxID=61654 RepID=A0A9W6IQY9_9HYPH|nr:hypothetical protein [Methylopila capsulata]MBM7851792.1 hypothetical protein [Methylopila capsulata]GLK54856.1 hypothetical protein GCM10008170_08750 [Methylopila capsulata]
MTDSAERAADVIAQIAAAMSSEATANAADQGLARVAQEGSFDDRYRVWRGRSGARYLVTVMPLGEAIRIENGVVLVVAVEADGSRRVVWAGESGAGLPGLRLEPGLRVEAHVHLIALSAKKRQAAIDDLADGAQSYSSVLSVSADASQASVGSVTPSRSNSRTVFRT